MYRLVPLIDMHASCLAAANLHSGTYRHISRFPSACSPLLIDITMSSANITVHEDSPSDLIFHMNIFGNIP